MGNLDSREAGSTERSAVVRHRRDCVADSPDAARPVSLSTADHERDAAGKAARLTVDVVTTYRDFVQLKDEWETLLAVSAANLVFLTHEWFRCWYDAFGQGGDLHIICVRRNGRLVGVAPLRLVRSSFRGFPVRKLAFPVNGYTADADFLLAEPRESILRAVVEQLVSSKGQWDLLELGRLRTSSWLATALPGTAASCGLAYFTRPDIQVPIVTIAGTWEEFLSQRSRDFRKKLNKRLRTIRQHPQPVTVMKVSSVDEVADALPAIFAVSSRSWKAQHKRALSDHPDERRFFEQLTAVLGARGWVDAWLVFCARQLVAFEYHLNYRGTTCPIRADFDEAFQAISPGAYLEESIIRACFEDPRRAVREYNTCADNYAYERRWPHRICAHQRAWLLSPSWRGRMLYPLALLRHPLQTRATRTSK